MKTQSAFGRLPRDDLKIASETTSLLVEQQASATANGNNGSEDADVIWWKDEDPKHPYNWPRWQTVSNCSLITAMTFLTALASGNSYDNRSTRSLTKV
jgi:hypothetical protein